MEPNEYWQALQKAMRDEGLSEEEAKSIEDTLKKDIDATFGTKDEDA